MIINTIFNTFKFGISILCTQLHHILTNETAALINFNGVPEQLGLQTVNYDKILYHKSKLW